MMFYGECQTCKVQHQSVEHPWASRGQHAARAILITKRCLWLESHQRCDLQCGCETEVRRWRCPRADEGIGQLCAETQHAANTKTHEILGRLFFLNTVLRCNQGATAHQFLSCFLFYMFIGCFQCILGVITSVHGGVGLWTGPSRNGVPEQVADLSVSLWVATWCRWWKGFGPFEGPAWCQICRNAAWAYMRFALVAGWRCSQWILTAHTGDMKPSPLGC